MQFLRRNARDIALVAAEIVGLGLMTAGIASYSEPAAVIFAGAALVAFGEVRS